LEYLNQNVLLTFVHNLNKKNDIFVGEAFQNSAAMMVVVAADAMDTGP